MPPAGGFFCTTSYHSASRYPLEPHKLLRHAPQPCELVDGVSFVLADKVIGQQELDGEGVCFALELARGEERMVRHEGCVDVWMQDGMAELMRADELQHRLVQFLIEMDHVQPEGIAVKAQDIPERCVEYLDMAVAGNLKRAVSVVLSRDVLRNDVNIHECKPRYYFGRTLIGLFFPEPFLKSLDAGSVSNGIHLGNSDTVKSLQSFML